MSKQDNKFIPVLFLQALLSGQKIKIGQLYYYLGGDLLDLCVGHDKDGVSGIILSSNFRQFINLARTMTEKEIRIMADNLRKSGVS